MPHVRLGCVRRADMSQFSHVFFGHLFCIFPSRFLSSVIFPYSIFVLGLVSPSSFLSLSCVSLVSSSCSCFFSCFSTVYYSAVRFDCPSIIFLFAHLGYLLESVEGECLEWVSLFVGEDCPYNFVLSSLFPLVSHSTGVARLLKMFEVR